MPPKRKKVSNAQFQGSRRRIMAIVTSVATESASIFRISFARCAFTVISLMPSRAATCWFSDPIHHQLHDLALAGREGVVTPPELAERHPLQRGASVPRDRALNGRQQDFGGGAQPGGEARS
jgi:hypothetical protein